MRSSSELAGAASPRPRARQLPISTLWSLVVIVIPPVLSFLMRSGRIRSEFLHTFVFAFGLETLPCACEQAHQSHWQIEYCKHVDAPEHVLPPRNQRAQIFAQTEHDGGTDGGADQRSCAPKNDHQQ